MPKKHIVCFLILSILNFTSCTSLEVLNKEDVYEGQAEINLSDELYLTTKDFTRYHFLAFNYQIENNILYGSGTMESDSLITPFKGSVTLQNVINFQQNKTDTGATILLIAGIITVGLITLAVIGLSDISDN